MEMRALGRSGLQVAPLVFGGNVFGWTCDRKTSFDLLDAFVDAGFNGIDTADSYSYWVPGNRGGESETIIGQWLKAHPSKRGKVLLMTKVGMKMGEGCVGLSARWIERAVEDSLRRLQTDVIDLYQSHKPDAETPHEETLAAYDKLLKAGKIRAIGPPTSMRNSWSPRSMPLPGTACLATRRCSPNTTSTIAPGSTGLCVIS